MIYHVFTTDEKWPAHKRQALKSWEKLYAAGTVEQVALVGNDMFSLTLGDYRRLPFLGDVLLQAREKATLPGDIVLLTNDDTILHEALPRFLESLLQGQGAACSFRLNVPAGWQWPDLLDREILAKTFYKDYGRDLFAFTRAWLDEHWPRLPLKMFLGEYEWDLILAILIRKSLGIETHRTQDLHLVTPAELPLGYVLHELHEPAWLKPEMASAPAKLWNKAQAKEWYQREGLMQLYTLG